MGRNSTNPGKPKGKMSAYAFFVQDSRQEMKKKEPNKTIGFATFSKQASEKWRSMSDKDKKKYNDLAAKDQVRYKEEMAEYVPQDDDTKKRKRGARAGKAVKDPNAPKRALSAFFCFCNEERPKVKADHPGYAVKDVAVELGRRWEGCTDRSRFDAMAAKDKERYLKEKALYENGQANGGTAKPSAAAKKTRAAAAAKPPAKKTKRGKETEDEDDDEEEEDEVDDEEDEEEEEEDESN